MQIILASSSPFRRALLERLGLTFSSDSPDIDETPLAGEAPESLVRRLSGAKASAIAERHPGSLVIGSDQVAVLEGRLLGKPGDHTHALAQLSACSGREVTFFTGLCVLGGDRPQYHVDHTHVAFRTLTGPEIERYLTQEQPYQSAGSFKVEALGISLFETVRSEDPTALIGLPLIALCRMLRHAGFDVP